jgi:hypothetical protein
MPKKPPKMFGDRRYRAKNPVFRRVMRGMEAALTLLQGHQNR